MSDRATPALPAIPGIDLNFRPTSYFWPLGLETHLLARIKGAKRKAALRRLIEHDNFGSIPELLTNSSLTETDRRAMGRLHPAFLGGEFLPDMLDREVEIARLTIASVTQDVTSVYAKRGKNRIYYRVVDEYDGGTLSESSTRTSTRPLSLGQLETFFNSAWSIFQVLAMNFNVHENSLGEMLTFVAAESPFYPQLNGLYRARIVAWSNRASTCTASAPSTTNQHEF